MLSWILNPDNFTYSGQRYQIPFCYQERSAIFIYIINIDTMIITEKEKIELASCMPPIMEELRKEKKHSSVHSYGSAINSFTRFSDKQSMLLGDVFTPVRLMSYQEWLRENGKSWNTVSSYMRVLQAVYNRLYPIGCENRNPKMFNDVYTKVVPQVKRALTKEQMQTLAQADWEQLSDNMKFTLVCFLLMFYFRGMPFIDLAYLRKKDLKGDLLVYCRHKTGRQMTVRIERQAMLLLEKFMNKDPDSPYLFPILNGKLRGELQIYECYLNALRNFNRNLENVGKQLLPGVKISSYTARHTWATLAFYKGWPIGMISKALGHSSIKVTETYLKPFEDEKVHEANQELLDSVA